MRNAGGVLGSASGGGNERIVLALEVNWLCDG